MNNPILITGAAGFIDANMAAMLREAGHSVVALDNLSHGHREYIPDDVTFEEVDCRDQGYSAKQVIDCTQEVTEKNRS